MAESDDIKPHAVMVEFLFQGHITPFIHLAVALASKGCTVTYVQTEFIHHLITKASAQSHHKQPDFIFSEARESGLDIRYTMISDGFPLDFDRDLNFVEFYASILRDFPGRVDELVGKIVESDHGGHLMPFLVADAAYLWPPAVASKYKILNVSFWTQPVIRLSIGYHLELLKEKGLLCSYGDYKDHIHDDIPGVKSSNVRDFIKYAPTEDDPYAPPILNESVMKAHLEVRKADFILCNTVQELELDAILALNQKLPIYAIGPTNFLANFDKVPIIDSLRSETDCAQWLNTKPPCSVLFVSFGSIAQTNKQVIWEIAHGLSISHVNFLWVLRADAVNSGGETHEVLPPGFSTDIGDRGLIIPWCNQRKVLSHPAVGGFLTHCGWSSLQESIWFGVPMICYPFFMDQPTNRNMVVDDWKIGINLCDKPPISKEEVVGKINCLMSGTTLDDLRLEMKKVSRIVHNALAINGSSHRNLDKFLRDLMEKISTRSKDMVV